MNESGRFLQKSEAAKRTISGNSFAGNAPLLRKNQGAIFEGRRGKRGLSAGTKRHQGGFQTRPYLSFDFIN